MATIRWGRRIVLLLVCGIIVCALISLRSVQNQNHARARVFRFENRISFDDKSLNILNQDNSKNGLNNDKITSLKVNSIPSKVSGEPNAEKILSEIGMKPLIYKSIEQKWPKSEKTIPKIIHQTWSSSLIPKSLVKWVQTFRDKNPDFEYWFWSDNDALQLVKKRYPEYLDLYKKFEKPIQRADVMRYFLLHEFGGFYADLDISAVKYLDPLRDHPCIVSQEPWVHAKVYWGWDRLMPCNAFMASTPKHPFMKMLITTIPRNFHGNAPGDVMNKTGPMMLDRILNDYNKLYAAKNYKNSDRIFLAEPNLFHPNFDPNLRVKYIHACQYPDKYHLSQSEMAECKDRKSHGFRFDMPREAYTDHHWMHFWVGGSFIKKVNPSKNIHIKDVVPDVKNVTQLLSEL